MITDIFARRYEKIELRAQYFAEDHRFMNQAVQLVGNALWTDLPDDDSVSDATETGLKSVHKTIALELGRDTLSDLWWWSTSTWNGNATRTPHKNTHAQMVKAFLVKIPEDVKKGDAWVKERLSLVELAYRYRAQQVALANQQFPQRLAAAEARDQQPYPGLRIPGSAASSSRFLNKRMNDAFSTAVSDLNERMRLANYRLHYHNGFIQLSDDELVAAQISEPFWKVVSDPRFANVDLQMKEAFDRRDNLDRTAAFHAVCALESCIKIISDLKAWTHGGERGAANYIDNLSSKKNGSFIDLWEANTMKAMFNDVRNPFAHGPGRAAMPELSIEQTDSVIQISMTWCKSLLDRFR